MTFEQTTAHIRGMLSDKRFAHTMGTVEEAGRLAAHWGADVDKARLAALCHDCCKELERDRAEALRAQFDVALDDFIEPRFKLWHPDMGVAYAQHVFGVIDAEVLSAIRNHSLGAPDMPLLDQLLYLADFIEPGRNYPGVMAMRLLSYNDLDEAMLMGLSFVMGDLIREYKPIHPRQLELYNQLTRNR